MTEQKPAYETDPNEQLDQCRAEKIVSWLSTVAKEQQEKFFCLMLELLSNEDCEMIMRILEEMQAPPKKSRKRKKIEIDDDLLKEFDEAAREWEQWEAGEE